MRRPSSATLIKIVAVWSLLVLAIFCPIILLSPSVPLDAKVTTRMMLGAIILWVGVCGALMFGWREAIVRRVRACGWPEGRKFVLFATALACVEEAITTLMTNLAPVLGGTLGVQGITNSTNWLHVVTLHSVVTFVPAFFMWAWLLRRFSFDPKEVFLLYGLTGMLAEGIFVRPDALVAGYWIFIYGLFVYLPACAMQRPADLRTPKLRHHVAAVTLPMVLAMPVAFAAIAIDRALGLAHVGAP